MGGWGGFSISSVHDYFFKIFCCVDYFFFIIPCSIFFSKNCWRAGGGGGGGVKTFFQDVKIFSGHTEKRGQENFSGLTSVQLRFKTHFPSQILLKT
jgi:hypothetical protein